MAFNIQNMKKYQEEDADKYEVLIDEQLKHTILGYNGVDIIVSGEIINEFVRDELRKRYRKAGWTQMHFKTSSENGERPGLTRITMS